MRYHRLYFILLFSLLGTFDTFGAPATRFVDFRLTYPILSFKSGISIQQKNYLGMDLSYQRYFVSNKVGYVINPYGWVVPVKVQANSVGVGISNKSWIANGGLQLGVIFRPLPSNWFDPNLTMYAGAGFSDLSGDVIDTRLVVPMGAKTTINLWRGNARLADNSVALTFSSSVAYHYKAVEVINPIFFDVGLGLRGTF